MKDNVIYITDENGKEVEMNILLTFEANEKKYVVTYETGNEDDVYPFIYDDDGNLFEVETDEELQMIQEIVTAYEDNEEK